MTEHERAERDYAHDLIEDLVGVYPEDMSAGDMYQRAMSDLKATKRALVELHVEPLPPLAECRECRWLYGARIYTCVGHADWIRDRKRDHLEAP